MNAPERGERIARRRGDDHVIAGSRGDDPIRCAGGRERGGRFQRLVRRRVAVAGATGRAAPGFNHRLAAGVYLDGLDDLNDLAAARRTVRHRHIGLLGRCDGCLERQWLPEKHQDEKETGHYQVLYR